MCWKTGLKALDRLKPRKLSFKLTFLYSVLFSAVLIALNAGTLFGVRYFLIGAAKDQVRSSASHTLHEMAASGHAPDLSAPAYLSESETVSQISVRIADARGTIENASGRTLSDMPAPTANIGVLIMTELHEHHLIIENSRIIKDGSLLGYLQISYDMQSEYHFIKVLFVCMAFADLLGVAFSFCVGVLLSRRALRPIDRLTKAARQISAGDLDRRVEVEKTDDELSRLAATFNEMIGRLQQSFEKQNRFVSDASHELRTPIAVIKGYADLIEQWAKNNPKVLGESVAAIRKEAKSMTCLTENLLFLARGDSGRLKIHKENFSVPDLLKEMTEESRLIAPDHHFECAVPKDVLLCADRKMIKQALRALVDNGIQYTPEGGSIQICAVKKQEKLEITVADSGIGISDKDLPHVFDRFYRVDKDRSREKGGSGLGLAIVQSIVQAHNGVICIRSGPGQGTAVTMTLPEVGISKRDAASAKKSV